LKSRKSAGLSMLFVAEIIHRAPISLLADSSARGGGYTGRAVSDRGTLEDLSQCRAPHMSVAVSD
jgi:hypothetical protein